MSQDVTTKDLRSTTLDLVADQARSPKSVVLMGAGVLIGAGLLIAALYVVDVRSVAKVLASADPVWPFVVFLMTLVFMLTKAWRWQELLRVAAPVRFSTIFVAVYVGVALNFVVTHAGEVLRAIMVSAGHRVRLGTTLASVFVERLLDFVAMMVLILVFVEVAPGIPGYVRLAGLICAGIAVLCVAFLLLLVHPPAILSRAVAWCLQKFSEKRQEWVRSQAEFALLGLSTIKDARCMAIAIFASLLQWIAIVAAVWFSALAIGADVSAAAVIGTFVLLILGLTLPNSPMQIGTTQVAFIIGFGIDDLRPEPAVAASLVYMAFVIVPTMLIGGMLYVREQFSPIYKSVKSG